MAIPIPTPHSLVLKRSALSRDAGSNAASRDFATPSLTKTFKGLFQTRNGEVSQDAEGNTFPLDAILYTKDTDVLVEDRIEVSLPGTTDTFRVAGREAKYDLQGAFSHMELPMERDTRG